MNKKYCKLISVFKAEAESCDPDIYAVFQHFNDDWTIKTFRFNREKIRKLLSKPESQHELAVNFFDRDLIDALTAIKGMESTGNPFHIFDIPRLQKPK